MNAKLFFGLIGAGILFDLIDGAYSLIFMHRGGFRFLDPSTWSAVSYWDYLSSPSGAILTVLAILPWILLIILLRCPPDP